MIKQYKLLKKQNNFEIILHYKGVKVRVNFSGGNTYKGIPPKCSERDVFKQKAIENSQLFKDREIVLERTIAEPGDGKQAVAVQTKKEKEVKPRMAVKVVKKPADTPATKPQGTEPENLATKPQGTPEPAGDAAGTVAEGESKEFANLGEAILFIAQNWQVTATTEKEAREILKAHGINPKIKKG